MCVVGGEERHVKRVLLRKVLNIENKAAFAALFFFGALLVRVPVASALGCCFFLAAATCSH